MGLAHNLAGKGIHVTSIDFDEVVNDCVFEYRVEISLGLHLMVQEPS